jgi:hypothetical protein
MAALAVFVAMGVVVVVVVLGIHNYLLGPEGRSIGLSTFQRLEGQALFSWI